MTFATKAKEPFKVALAMVIAYGIALSMDWDNPYWAGLGVALISLSTVGQSFNKAAMRMFGTLAAAFFALTLIALFPQGRWLFMLSLSLRRLLRLHDGWGQTAVFLECLWFSLRDHLHGRPRLSEQ